MTKREYTKALAALVERKMRLTVELDAMHERYTDEIAYGHVAREWNNLHDALRDTEDDIRQLDTNWRRRKWTGADYDSYALVCANVD